ncbi:MAG: response regulator [Candidatus Hodarchaeales archaeon]
MQKTILIVDDDRDVLDLLSHYLAIRNYIVWTAQNSLEAISYSQRLPDVILLDIFFNSKQIGLEICKKIKDNKQTRNIPVILMSAMTYYFVDVTSVGDYYLPKPFTMAELERVIEELVH